MGVEGVQRDVDAADAGLAEREGEFGELGAVCCDCDFADAGDAGEVFAEGDDALSHQGLAAADADFVDAEFGEGAGDGVKFLQREDFAFGEEAHVDGHAVGASEVAAVGDGEADVCDAPSVSVDEGAFGLDGVGAGCAGAEGGFAAQGNRNDGGGGHGGFLSGGILSQEGGICLFVLLRATARNDFAYHSAVVAFRAGHFVRAVVV